MEVVPGIHRLDGTWGGNVSLLEHESGLALVDAALPGNAGKILRYIRQLNRDPGELRYIVLTHAHPDHTGTIPALLGYASARVAVRPEDTRRERDGRPRLFYPGQLVSLPWDAPFVRKIFAHELVEESSILPTMGGLKVLHTPGHTAGSRPLPGGARSAVHRGHAYQRWQEVLQAPSLARHRP